MINLVENYLEGKYASPKSHPITCANPSPWKIDEMRIEHEYDMDVKDCIYKIWIRNKDSMWFRADQCFVSDDIEELKECQRIHKFV